MIDFYGWRIEVIDMFYNDKNDIWEDKYIIRIGDKYLKLSNDYPSLVEEELKASIFTEPAQVLNSLYELINKKYIGWIQKCPVCNLKVQTTCCACGCGSCCVCGYKFRCNNNEIKYDGIIKSLDIRDKITEGIS